MPGQIFDDSGQQYSMADSSGLASAIVEVGPSIDSAPVTPPIVKPVVQAGTVTQIVPSRDIYLDGGWTGMLNGQHAYPVTAVLFGKYIADNGTYFWFGSLGNSLFPNQNRPYSVRTIILGKYLQLTIFRTWNGLGGTFYIPSFPQLERRETTWPHAT